MLSFECKCLMDPYKMKPQFLYKQGKNKVIDGLIDPTKNVKKGK